MEETKMEETVETPVSVADGTASALPITVKRKRGRPKTLAGTIKVADVVNAVMQTGGHVQDAIKVLGMSNGDFYKRFRYQPKVVRALQQAREIGFESVTDVLYSLALKGDIKAMSLYLKYNPLAKQNGWVENQTLTIKEEKPLSPEEKQQLAKELFG